MASGIPDRSDKNIHTVFFIYLSPENSLTFSRSFFNFFTNLVVSSSFLVKFCCQCFSGICGVDGRATACDCVSRVRSLPAAPSRCGRGPSGSELLGCLINQLGHPPIFSIFLFIQFCIFVLIFIYFF
jgi:hypothetical protein